MKLLKPNSPGAARHHYSIHTERTSLDGMKRYVAFHRLKSRHDLAEIEKKIEAFFTQRGRASHRALKERYPHRKGPAGLQSVSSASTPSRAWLLPLASSRPPSPLRFLLASTFSTVLESPCDQKFQSAP
jgi:hypothetical protein